MTQIRSVFLVAALLVLLGATPLAAGGNREEPEAEQDAAAAEAEPIAIDDAVARVNGELVGRAEFDDVVASNIARWEYQSGESFDAAQRPQLEQQVLDGLITRTILEQEADDLDIVVTDESFSETLAQFTSQFPNEEAYRIALEEQGFSEGEFEDELRRQMLIEELIRTQVYDQIEISDDDMQAFYDENPQFFEQSEQVAARHIIFTTQGASEADQTALREELQGIRQEIADGADFAEMAREHSQGPSAADGGNLGVFGRGQMVPAFEETAFALEVGELSEVIETQFGYHIVQVTERIPAQTQSFADSREQIRQFLTEEERNTAAQAYVQGLRGAAEVEELIELQ